MSCCLDQTYIVLDYESSDKDQAYGYQQDECSDHPDRLEHLIETAEICGHVSRRA